MSTDFFKDKRVLVTGGVGFIGSNLALRLANEGAQVLLVDSLIPEYGGNLHNIAAFAERVQVNISDVRDRYSMDHLVRNQDFVFNLAGQTSHMDSMHDPATDLEINCRAQLSILEACRQHNPDVKIVFASTRQIYGKPQYLPVDEKHRLYPTDVNGVNKMAGEWYHILYNNVYGLRSCALRLTNTYGPRMRIKDARQTFLGIWIKLLLQNQPFEVWGGEQLRDFTYVDDCVEALLLAASSEECNGHVYNLGGVQPYSLQDFAQLLVEANDGQGEYSIRSFPAERKAIDIGGYYADDAAFCAAVGWRPQVDERGGLKRTLSFYRADLEHYL